MITKRFFSRKQEAAASSTLSLSLSLLSEFAPFNALSAPQAFKNILAYSQAKGFQLKKGKTLFDLPDSDQQDFYLLEGAINLVANDGRLEVITSESPKSKMPLAYLRPRKYNVVVASKTATLMSVPHNVVKIIYAQSQSEQKTQENDALYDQVLNPSELESVYSYFRDQQWERESCLVTPISVGKAMWSACLRSRDEVVLSRVVRQDVALSAKLIKIARGPLCDTLAGNSEVMTVADAVAVLGRTLSLELVHHFLVKGQFVNKLPALEKLVSFIAHRALQRAVITQTLSDLSTFPFDAQKAYECGLFFRIGDLAMLQSASEWVENEEHLANLQFVAERESLLVGYNLMRSWGFPSYLTDVLENCDNDNMTDNTTGLNYAKLVTAAQLLLGNVYRQSEKSEKMTQNSAAYTQVMASMSSPEESIIETCLQALDELKKARMAFMAAA